MSSQGDNEAQKAKDREELVKMKFESDKLYEKNITYITAGTLVLSLTFVEKIISLDKSYAIWILILAWSILVLTLLLT